MAFSKIIRAHLVVFLACFVSCVPQQQVRVNGPVTVAVWDLENLTPGDVGHIDLGEPLAARVIQTLKQSGAVIIIERQRLVLTLEELNLGTTSVVDENTRLEIGKMLGARRMVFGAYQVIADIMRLDLRLVDVETGKVVKVSKQISPGSDLTAWLKAAEEAAKDLL
jgi:curli biogenesis system outer membrane secretion channel CsgG